MTWTAAKTCTCAINDLQNLNDVRAYVGNFIQAHQEQPMTARIAAWKIGTDEFVELLTDKSQGNFMYLVHVLEGHPHWPVFVAVRHHW